MQNVWSVRKFGAKTSNSVEPRNNVKERARFGGNFVLLSALFFNKNLYNISNDVVFVLPETPDSQMVDGCRGLVRTVRDHVDRLGLVHVLRGNLGKCCFKTNITQWSVLAFSTLLLFLEIQI